MNNAAANAPVLDKFRGCLVGGAAGDALGYAVEFLSERSIFNRYGERGITEYLLRNGRAWISDDTQMTLFTANGLLVGATERLLSASAEGYPSYVAAAYRDWYKTQTRAAADNHSASWLMNVPELFAARAPGNTCLSGIEAGCRGTIERPPNGSKGCGGVMRVSPVGLYFGADKLPPLDADLLGAELAALTHGNEMGYIPAAMLVHIVRLLAHSGEITPKAAVLDGISAMRQLFPAAKALPQFIELIETAIAASESNMSDLRAIRILGPGWHGDEALAVAIYCALKYSNDFDSAIIAAVNHGGDSDSTGAITGNILGAYLGLSHIPEKYLRNLELLDVIMEIADDLYYGCPLSPNKPPETPREIAWAQKYISKSYQPNRAQTRLTAKEVNSWKITATSTVS